MQPGKPVSSYDWCIPGTGKTVALGNVKMYTRHEMLDVVVMMARLVVLFAAILLRVNWKDFLVMPCCCVQVVMAMYFIFQPTQWVCNVTAAWKAHKKGAYFGNPCFTQIHPTCIPVSGEYQSKLTLMSESLRNDGRIWVPKKQTTQDHPIKIPEEERDYYLERRYPGLW